MPTFADDAPGAKFTKLLVIGNGGSGKTGALASLVRAGYKLKIVDFDNGLPILVSQIKKIDRKLLANVEYETCTDPRKITADRAVATNAQAWIKGIKAAERFINSGMGEKDVLVIDTMTFAGKAAMRHILKLNGRLGGQVEQQHWYAAQNLLEEFIGMITADEVETNVIVNSHVQFMGPQDMQTGFPSTGTGSALSPQIGRYFNDVLLFTSVGPKKVMKTRTFGAIELKTAAPDTTRNEYPIDTALADYFADVRK